MKQKETINDFAARAGVSIATVSRAFTGNGRISEATRKRLLELAAKTGNHSGKPEFHCQRHFNPELIAGIPNLLSEMDDKRNPYPSVRIISPLMADFS